MCKVTLLCAILLLSGVRVMAQKVSVGSNVAYLVTTPNLGGRCDFDDPLEFECFRELQSISLSSVE